MRGTKKAIVELEDYQVKALVAFDNLSDNPSEEELGKALMSLINEYDDVMDALGEYYEEE